MRLDVEILQLRVACGEGSFECAESWFTLSQSRVKNRQRRGRDKIVCLLQPVENGERVGAFARLRQRIAKITLRRRRVVAKTYRLPIRGDGFRI